MRFYRIVSIALTLVLFMGIVFMANAQQPSKAAKTDSLPGGEDRHGIAVLDSEEVEPVGIGVGPRYLPDRRHR